MATLTAAYEGEKDPWKLATAVAATVTVLWLAHVYAHTLAESLAADRRRFGGLPSVARRELGIVLAGVLPFVALALGATTRSGLRLRSDSPPLGRKGSVSRVSSNSGSRARSSRPRPTSPSA